MARSRQKTTKDQASRLRAHKIRLSPTSSQVSYFVRCAGTARYSFNWSLTYSDAFYREHGKSISDYDLKNVWNAHRKAKVPWTYEVTKWAAESGVLNFCAARLNWFRDLKKQKKSPGLKQQCARRPRLKSKKRSKKTFTLYEFKCSGHELVVPKLGAVKMTEAVRFPGKIKSVTLSEQGGHWFASFLIELPEDYVYPHRCETQAVVGIDLGLQFLATLSTEGKLDNPKFYRRCEQKLKKLHQALSRTMKGSRNQEKARRRLNTQYARLGNLRSDHLHQMTTPIVRRYRFIGVEDLYIAGMLQSHSLARALSDASFCEIRRQLEYKAGWAGCHVVVADRFFPSSKLCSTCGHKNDELKLSDREWRCTQCGSHHDREINAARNLEAVARKYVADGQSDTKNACVTDGSETNTIGVVDVSLEGRESFKQSARTQETFRDVSSLEETL